MTDRQTNTDRITICRQVASLFALTTSSNAGEAANSKAKVKDLVKKHGLKFPDVEPFLNAIGLKVARSFWSLSDPPEMGRSTGTGTGTASASGMEEIFRQDILRQMRDEARRASERASNPYGRPFSDKRSRDAFNSFFRREYEGGWDWADPSEQTSENANLVYVTINGEKVLLREVPMTMLQQVQARCVSYWSQCEQRRGQAHDLIDSGHYEEATAILQRLQQGAPVSKADEIHIVEEIQRRMRRADPPRFWKY